MSGTWMRLGVAAIAAAAGLLAAAGPAAAQVQCPNPATDALRTVEDTVGGAAGGLPASPADTVESVPETVIYTIETVEIVVGAEAGALPVSPSSELGNALGCTERRFDEGSAGDLGGPADPVEGAAGPDDGQTVAQADASAALPATGGGPALAGLALAAAGVLLGRRRTGGA